MSMFYGRRSGERREQVEALSRFVPNVTDVSGQWDSINLIAESWSSVFL